MLGKLLKYEWRATAKAFLPLYAITLIMTILTKITTSFDIFQKPYFNIISGLVTTGYVLLLIALIIITCVLIIYRFYKNMVTDEGYLMHTLPVTPAQHILSKTIVAFCWSVISMLVFALSLFLLLITPQSWNLICDNLPRIAQELTKYGFSMPLLILESILLLIVMILHSIQYVYASISIGQVLSRNKILGAIAAAVILNFATQILTLILSMPALQRLARINSEVSFSSAFSAINTFLLVTCLVTLIFSVAFFLVTNFLLKKKLNLE